MRTLITTWLNTSDSALINSEEGVFFPVVYFTVKCKLCIICTCMSTNNSDCAWAEEDSGG